MAYDIAIIPGDGIGPELMDETVPLMREAVELNGMTLQTTRYEWGGHRYLDTGEVMPPDALERLKTHDAILLGGMGHPEVENVSVGHYGHHKIRKGFDQYVNLRPAYLFDGAPTPLSGYEEGDIDILWYRENTEGEYLNMGGMVERGNRTELAVQNSVFTRRGVERILRAAFDAALKRDRKVTSITKSNALPYGLGFWDEIVAEVSEEYPEVTLEELFVDAANMKLACNPEEFDVVVSSNLFGDILTELAAAITGGLGLAPSANINPDDDVPGMFEPVHGTAPDIAGEGVANPLATVLSAALLLEHLGEQMPASALRDVVSSNLSDSTSPRTPDIGGDAKTKTVVNDLRQRFNSNR